MSKKTIEMIEKLGKLQYKSLKEVGEKSGIGANSIYRWDKNEPKISTLKKVTNYWGLIIKSYFHRKEK